MGRPVQKTLPATKGALDQLRRDAGLGVEDSCCEVAYNGIVVVYRVYHIDILIIAYTSKSILFECAKRLVRGFNKTSQLGFN